MLAWLKRWLAKAAARKALDAQIENLPTQHADTSRNLSLDPRNDPFGRS